MRKVVMKSAKLEHLILETYHERPRILNKLKVEDLLYSIWRGFYLLQSEDGKSLGYTPTLNYKSGTYEVLKFLIFRVFPDQGRENVNWKKSFLVNKTGLRLGDHVRSLKGERLKVRSMILALLDVCAFGNCLIPMIL